MNKIPPPNYTQSPNFFYDVLLPQISSLAELKITSVIIRQTFGFHRQEKELSISTLMRLSGLSRQGAVDGVEKALARGTITRRPKAAGYLYRLIVADVHDLVSQDSRPEPVSDLDPPSQQIRPTVVNDSDPLKETVKRKVRKKEEINLELPDWLSMAIWNRWTDFRRDCRKPLDTQSMVDAQIRTLQRLHDAGQDIEAVIDQSIAARYQGLFEVKNGKAQQHGQSNGLVEGHRRANNGKPSRTDIIAGYDYSIFDGVADDTAGNH